MDPKEFDLIVSLGGSCAVAMQLIWRNMRPFSLPFDWMYMPDEKPVEYLANNGFKCGFRDFALKENLEDVSNTFFSKGYTSPVYYDKLTGYRLMHQFRHPSINPQWYEKDFAKLHSRFDRLAAVISKCRKVLFCLCTDFTFKNDLVLRLYEAIVKAYPNVEVHLKVMQFSAGRESESVQQFIDGKVEIVRFARAASVYDVSKTSVEWFFLDAISVKACATKKRLSRCEKWLYSIWKHLGKKVKRLGLETNFIFK